MVYTFLLLSTENEDFSRKVKISDSATFAELHTTILNTANYSNDLMTLFVITNHDWEKETEIMLSNMTDKSDEETLLMHNTKLASYLKAKGDRLLYTFDLFSGRSFFIELVAVEEGHLMAPQIVDSIGDAPQQVQIDGDFDVDNFDALLGDTDPYDLGDEFDDGFGQMESLDDIDLDSYSF